MRDSCASELNNTATPPPHVPNKPTYQPFKGWQSLIILTPSLLFSLVVAVVEADDMRRKSIFVGFRNERLRMTTPWPSHIYKEEILRWSL